MCCSTFFWNFAQFLVEIAFFYLALESRFFEQGGLNFGFWFLYTHLPLLKEGVWNPPPPPSVQTWELCTWFPQAQIRDKRDSSNLVWNYPSVLCLKFVEVILLQLALVRLTLLLTLFSIPSSRLHPSPLVRIPYSHKLPHLPLMRVPL